MFYVGVHCPIAILREREKERGDRLIGEAEYHLQNVHSYGTYDFEIDTSQSSPQECAATIVHAWHGREDGGSDQGLRYGLCDGDPEV